jgi:hypothetical protein
MNTRRKKGMLWRSDGARKMDRRRGRRVGRNRRKTTFENKHTSISPKNACEYSAPEYPRGMPKWQIEATAEATRGLRRLSKKQ